MRIIKAGTVIYPWVGEWSCRSCGCRWELCKQDIAILVPDQRDGDYYQMDCPTCGRKVDRSVKRLMERRG